MLNSFAALPILFYHLLQHQLLFQNLQHYCMCFFLGTILSGFFDLRDLFLRGGALYKTKKETYDIVSYDYFIQKARTNITNL